MNCMICMFASFVAVMLAPFPDDTRVVPPALEPFETLVGDWRAHGFLEADKLKGWDEPASWGWRFDDGKIVGLVANFKDGKYLVSATLEPAESKDTYKLAATNADQKKGTYEGVLKSKKLVLTRQSGDSTLPNQITIELLHDVRYQMLIEARKSKTSVKRVATIGATRADVRFGAVSKEELGPKCIITGAPGTSTVTFKGETYYVCCSGCRAEFEHDPEKWLKLAKEAKAKKGGS